MARAELPEPSSDLLFAWLSPIEQKMDRRLHPKTPSLNIPATSPLVTKARSALRRTVRASHVNSMKNSEKKAKIKEAKDACYWLKAAGFPQYVQMFEDGQFPINLTKFQVEKDHCFLEAAELDALLRRLNALNRSADVMESVHNRGGDSDEEIRALSDNWQFRRKQKRWLRRRGSKMATPQDTLFSSTEDLLEDHSPDTTGTPTDQPRSPLLLVSELRKSLTGLDRAVKTYSFMVTEDQLPQIQVEDHSRNYRERSTLQKSSEYSSFDSEEDSWETGPYPSGGMDNFATGMMDTFETNLLKLKDYQTQSLPDVFQATKHYHEDGSSDISPLSSASVSTVSILDQTELLDTTARESPSLDMTAREHESPSELTRTVCSSAFPLTQNSQTTSPKEVRRFEEELTPASSESEGGKVQLRKRPNSRLGSAGSGHTWGSSSPVGSESSERESVSAPSPQPLALERLKGGSGGYVGNGLVGGSNGVLNGVDVSPHHSREPSTEEVPKRLSRTSVNSSKLDEPMRRFEAKWHSYQRPHNFRATFKPVRSMIPIEELSVGQISVLRKLSLIKLTAQLELYCFKTKTNITRMLKGKKQKLADTRTKRVFGLPLSANVRHLGQALPPVILNAMQYLRENEQLKSLGLFRRAASKARVEFLREVADTNPELSNFEEFTPYEVADMIKLYCRELPEPILTSKLSEILILIQENVPSQVRLPALQAVMLLLPDENREALWTFLLFLKEVAAHSGTNQMTVQNLAVCFAPTLFALSNPMPKASASLARRGSFKRTAVVQGLSPSQMATSKGVNDSVVSSHCLAQMVHQVDKLFQVATDMLQVCRFTHLETGDPVPYYELGLDRKGSGMHGYLDSCVQTILRESRKKFKAWTHCESVGGVEVSYLKPRDGVRLWVWRGVCEVKASSSFLHRKLWMDRFVWDSGMTAPKQVTKIDEQTEIFQYVTPSVPPHTARDLCLLRSWQYDLSSQSYVLVATSVSHPSASLQGGIRATQLATCYLVEPLDSERSRLSYITRVDMRGRSSEYYNKAYGPYLASTVSRIRDACKDHNLLETSV